MYKKCSLGLLIHLGLPYKQEYSFKIPCRYNMINLRYVHERCDKNTFSKVGNADASSCFFLAYGPLSMATSPLIPRIIDTQNHGICMDHLLLLLWWLRLCYTLLGLLWLSIVCWGLCNLSKSQAI